MIRRPRIVKGWVVNKTQGRTIRNVIGSVGGQPTTIQLTTVNLTAEQLSLRDGPSEKLWGGGEFSSRRNLFSLSNSLYEFF